MNKLNIEEFTPIPGFEDYLINRKGEVFSKKVNRLLTPQKNQNGYSFIRLHKDKKQYSFLVHRLLAFVYLNLESLGSELEVDHKDSNINNNSIDNLQVLTKEEHLIKTHGEWRRQKTRKCSCGNNLSEFNTSGNCITCINRQKLNDGVTAELIEYWVINYSWVRASKELGLSDNGLRKRYTRLTGKSHKNIKDSLRASK